MAKQLFENSNVIATGKLLSENPDTGEVYLEKDGTAYGLNLVGRRVWELIQQPIQVSQARDILLAEYAVEPERCTRELLELLNDLLDQGLAELVDG